jgi:hypothetical protein
MAYLPKKKHGNTPHSVGILPWGKKHANMRGFFIREKNHGNMALFGENFFRRHLEARKPCTRSHIVQRKRISK